MNPNYPILKLVSQETAREIAIKTVNLLYDDIENLQNHLGIKRDIEFCYPILLYSLSMGDRSCFERVIEIVNKWLQCQNDWEINIDKKHMNKYISMFFEEIPNLFKLVKLPNRNNKLNGIEQSFDKIYDFMNNIDSILFLFDTNTCYKCLNSLVDCMLEICPCKNDNYYGELIKIYQPLEKIFLKYFQLFCLEEEHMKLILKKLIDNFENNQFIEITYESIYTDVFHEMLSLTNNKTKFKYLYSIIRAILSLSKGLLDNSKKFSYLGIFCEKSVLNILTNINKKNNQFLFEAIFPSQTFLCFMYESVFSAIPNNSNCFDFFYYFFIIFSSENLQDNPSTKWYKYLIQFLNYLFNDNQIKYYILFSILNSLNNFIVQKSNVFILILNKLFQVFERNLLNQDFLTFINEIDKSNWIFSLLNIYQIGNILNNFLIIKESKKIIGNIFHNFLFKKIPIVNILFLLLYIGKIQEYIIIIQKLNNYFQRCQDGRWGSLQDYDFINCIYSLGLSGYFNPNIEKLIIENNIIYYLISIFENRNIHINFINALLITIFELLNKFPNIFQKERSNITIILNYFRHCLTQENIKNNSEIKEFIYILKNLLLIQSISPFEIQQEENQLINLQYYLYNNRLISIGENNNNNNKELFIIFRNEYCISSFQINEIHNIPKKPIEEINDSKIISYKLLDIDKKLEPFQEYKPIHLNYQHSNLCQSFLLSIGIHSNELIPILNIKEIQQDIKEYDYYCNRLQFYVHITKVNSKSNTLFDQKEILDSSYQSFLNNLGDSFQMSTCDIKFTRDLNQSSNILIIYNETIQPINKIEKSEYSLILNVSVNNHFLSSTGENIKSYKIKIVNLVKNKLIIPILPQDEWVSIPINEIGFWIGISAFFCNVEPTLSDENMNSLPCKFIQEYNKYYRQRKQILMDIVKKIKK